MLKKVKRLYNASIIYSILLAVLGIIMIVRPGTTLDVICKVFAAYAIIRGAYLVIINFTNKDVDLPYEPLVPGVIFLVLGIIVFTNPNYLENIMSILVSVWIILGSLNDISISLKLRKTDAPWVLTLIIALISLIAGIVLLVNPQTTADAIMIWSGIVLLINSVTSLVDKLIFKKYAKELEKDAKNFVKKIKE